MPKDQFMKEDLLSYSPKLGMVEFKELVNMQNDLRSGKGVQDTSIRTKAKQAEDHIRAIPDIAEKDDDEANKRREQYYRYIEERIDLLPPEKRNDEKEIGAILDDATSPVFEGRTDRWGANRYKFEAKGLKDEQLSDKRNVPEALKDYPNVQYNKKARMFIAPTADGKGAYFIDDKTGKLKFGEY